MRLPSEWADAAKKADLPLHAREFTRISGDFTAWAVRFGEKLNAEVEAGTRDADEARDILDRLYDQRSYRT